MGFFNAANENRVKCGRCNTEFDLARNDGCPLCGFGNKNKSHHQEPVKTATLSSTTDYLAIPKELKARKGKVTSSKEAKAIGSWGMFNSFFPGKAVLRILANHLTDSKKEYVTLKDLIQKSTEVIKMHDLSKFRGFPNDPDSDSSVGRLVNHFIRTYTDMGFFEVIAKQKEKDSVWDENWSNIEITITKEGYEFAKLRNRILDDHEDNQVLTEEEKTWLTAYLKSIDSEYKEYSMLLAVYRFIKSGHNGKDELWSWFKTNKTFVDYVREWSRKADDAEAFKEQINNLAPTFASAKLALLREFGVIKNKRNDYTVVGALE